IEISSPESARPNPNFEGIGLGMRAWVFSLLTDVWGAIPYTEALAGSAPAYDPQETVYAGIIDHLALANENLHLAGPPTKGDILLDGDILKRKKLINTPRFKLLNRRAHQVPGSGTEMQTMLGDPATYPMIGSNDEIAQLVYGA